MIKIILRQYLKASLSLLILATYSSIFAQSNNHNKLNIGLGYPIMTNGVHARYDTANFTLALLINVSSGERGFTFSGISNFIKNDTKGFQIAGISNHIGKNAGGTSIAGIVNSYNTSTSLALAGVTNISKGQSKSQIAGLVNKATDVGILQISGLINIAKNVKGLQAAGFINVAKKLKGLQLSLINIADSANTQIGLVNISKNGEKELTLSINEDQTILLAFHSGGKRVYGILGIGYNYANKLDNYALEIGLGAHIINMRSFRLNTEIVTCGLQSFKGGVDYRSSLTLIPVINITHKLKLFGGPSLNYINTNTEDGRNSNHHLLSGRTSNNGVNLYGFYFGYQSGIKVSL